MKDGRRTKREKETRERERKKERNERERDREREREDVLFANFLVLYFSVVIFTNLTTLLLTTSKFRKYNFLLSVDKKVIFITKVFIFPSTFLL
jgi:hypothetical protein